MNIVPGEVLASHAESMRTLRVEAVTPEVNDIALDPEAVLEAANRFDNAWFSVNHSGYDYTINYLHDTAFEFSADGLSRIRPKGKMGEGDTPRMQNVGHLLEVIDSNFRELCGLPEDVLTQPKAHLLNGIFVGLKGETTPHFDYDAKKPRISYKMYFEGKPEFATVYYPATYRLPSMVRAALEGFGRIEARPRPVTAWKKIPRHVMPAGVVCVEPWNTFHSGPTDKHAKNTRRGVLAVTYDLSKLPIAEEKLA